MKKTATIMPDQSVPDATGAPPPAATARRATVALPTYAAVARSQLPPLFDDDNVYPFPLYPYQNLNDK